MLTDLPLVLCNEYLVNIWWIQTKVSHRTLVSIDKLFCTISAWFWFIIARFLNFPEKDEKRTRDATCDVLDCWRFLGYGHNEVITDSKSGANFNRMSLALLYVILSVFITSSKNFFSQITWYLIFRNFAFIITCYYLFCKQY